MYGVIYRAKFEEDGRSYIGQTIKKLQKRINEHRHASKNPKYHFHRALQKYGFDKFSWEVLQECYNKEELDNAEIYWIKFYNSIDNGFNNREGGFSSQMLKETREKLSKDRMGEKNPMYGKNSAIRGRCKEFSIDIPTKFKTGNIPWNKGKKYSNGKKITFEIAQEIRILYFTGMLIRELCSKFNVKPNTIFNIISGKSWATKKYIKDKKIRKPHLTKEQIYEILQLVKLKIPRKEIAIKYNIDVSNISKLLKREKDAENNHIERSTP